MEDERRPSGERDLRGAAVDLVLGTWLGALSVGICADVERAVLQGTPNAEAKIFFGSIITIATATLSKSGFQRFWREIHKPKTLEPPTDS